MDKVIDASAILYICSTLTTSIIVLASTVRKLPAFVYNILQATWLERVPVLMSWQELPGLGPLTFHQKGRSPSSAWWGCGSSPFYVLQYTVKPLETVHTVNYLLTLKLAGWGILCPISWLGFIVGVRLMKPSSVNLRAPVVVDQPVELACCLLFAASKIMLVHQVIVERWKNVRQALWGCLSLLEIGWSAKTSQQLNSPE